MMRRCAIGAPGPSASCGFSPSFGKFDKMRSHLLDMRFSTVDSDKHQSDTLPTANHQLADVLVGLQGHSGGIRPSRFFVV